MASNYRTPAVYIEEISTLPPSVAEVSTAIPAFLGYTELHAVNGTPQVGQVSTMLDYINLFGGPQIVAIEVTGSADNLVPKVPDLPYLHVLQPQPLLHEWRRPLLHRVDRRLYVEPRQGGLRGWPRRTGERG